MTITVIPQALAAPKESNKIKNNPVKKVPFTRQTAVKQLQWG